MDIERQPYQKIILCLLAAMAVLFAVWTAVSRTHEGVAFQETLLTIHEEDGQTVYSGKLYGTPFTITCREENGTTHADFAFGAVPCTRDLTKEEIEGEYELNTGKVIAETFENGNIDCNAVPAVLVHSHGPFTWGKNGMEAAKNSAILEEVAKMAYLSRTLEAKPASEDIRKKHYYRKHGAGAYYGQK